MIILDFWSCLGIYPNKFFCYCLKIDSNIVMGLMGKLKTARFFKIYTGKL